MIANIGSVTPATHRSRPFGTAYLADSGRGVDLEPHGYVEEERLVSGVADEWSYNHSCSASPRTKNVPFTTRMLIRRPVEGRGASGLVLLEPLHPNLDSAMTWRTTHEWALRNGHTWVGVTQDASMAGMLRDRFGQRYSSISIPRSGLGYDILGDVAVALRTGAVPDISAERIILSGWSATGSFCRVYLQDGFHDRHRLPDGTPAVDGIAICISSGAAGQAGYPPLSADCPPLSAGDPRRIVHGDGRPVFEILSEMESETHFASLRPDSDDSDDRYRLYQIAGTSHVDGHDESLTNAEQSRQVGIEVPDNRINEGASDARMDLVAHALFEALDRWIADDIVPPVADRFDFADGQGEHEDPAELVRDRHGNVAGGIRTPWIDAPVASYAPHSTPAPASCQPPAWSPLGTPELVARLIGNRTPFSPETLGNLYSSRQEFLDRYADSVRNCADQGFLLPLDSDILIEHAATT